MKPLYTKLGIEYQQAYSGPYKVISVENLILGEKDEVLSGFGRPIVCLDKSDEKCLGKIWLSNEPVWYMDYLADGNIDNISRFLLKQGKIPTPFYTQILDLTKNEQELHSEMRKSYQNLANKGNVILTKSIAELKKLHIQVCGRQTRSDLTWEIQQRMIDAGEAFVMYLDDYSSGGLFIHDGTSCYYGVGKSLDGVHSHPVIWRAILHAKELGCREFEMGEQVFSGDEKQVGISNFKRGFGGETKLRLEFKP